MTKINVNTNLIESEISRYLDYARRDFENIISINNEIRYYSDFEEGRNLQNFINDSYSLKSDIENLKDWADNSKKRIESTSYDLEDNAYKLPYREISHRKGLL